MKCKMTFKLAQQLKYLVVNMLKCVSDLEDWKLKNVEKSLKPEFRCIPNSEKALNC